MNINITLVNILGQILNRVSRIAKSYLNDEGGSVQYHNLNSDEDELKRKIDELNKKKTESKSSKAEPSGKGMAIEEAYRILEVPRTAAIEEIKSAYKKKIMEYHPDRVANLGTDLKNLAKQKTIEINLAYELIEKTLKI